MPGGKRHDARPLGSGQAMSIGDGMDEAGQDMGSLERRAFWEFIPSPAEIVFAPAGGRLGYFANVRGGRRAGYPAPSSERPCRQ